MCIAENIQHYLRVAVSQLRLPGLPVPAAAHRQVEDSSRWHLSLTARGWNDCGSLNLCSKDATPICVPAAYRIFWHYGTDRNQITIMRPLHNKRIHHPLSTIHQSPLTSPSILYIIHSDFEWRVKWKTVNLWLRCFIL